MIDGRLFALPLSHTHPFTIPMPNRLAPALAALAFALLSGCAGTGALTDTRTAFLDANPGIEARQTMRLGVGPMTMGFARMVLRASGDSSARETASMLRHVRRARLRIYETTPRTGPVSARAVAAGRMPALSARLRRQGWTPLLRARGDDGEATWILVRERRGHAVGMLLAALDGESLVLMEASGRLDALVEEAMTRYSGAGN